MKTQTHNIKRARLLVAVVALMVGTTIAMSFTLPNEDEAIDRPIIKVTGGSANLKAIYRFHDVNDTQIVAAQNFGIEPLKLRSDIDSVLTGKLSLVESSNIFKIDKLTHSVPYLTPSAAQLLLKIATNFQQKLRDNGFAQYRFIVTSLLRTEDDVRRLMRVNRNAVKKSCHMYATTFDIAYNCFEKVDIEPDFEGDDATHRQLVNLLGETLQELRDGGLCFIKFERGQPCFHITTRQ